MNATTISRIRSYLDDEPTMREARPWHQLGAELALTVRAPETRTAEPWRRRPSEALESLSLPDGLREEMLVVGEAPRGPLEARIWVIRVARDLARDYRVRYGIELRCDAQSIERMQRHLSAVVQPLGRRDAKAVAREVVRHGLVLGEILVRLVGATWTGLTGDRPGTWELSVPTGETLNPNVSVQRFLQQGSSGSDLVAIFLDLDAARRRAAI